MSTKKIFSFNNIKTFLLVFILFFIFNIIYLVVFPHEAFCMEPYENITFEDIDEEVRARLILSIKQEYINSHSIYTRNNISDIFRSLYPNGIPRDSSMINDTYDNEVYFDIPITMTYGIPQNIDLSPGIYSGCIAKNIDGLII